ncbi:retrovirus-related pol polyprotein from transposon TNT 1-94 [Tanacetum coccineum]
MIQVCLNVTVQNIQTDNGTEFFNQTLRAYYEDVEISHQTSVTRSPQQNGVVERQNQTLVEAVRTMLIFSKPMFDEYFNPPPSVASLVLAVAAPVPADLTGSPNRVLK